MFSVLKAVLHSFIFKVYGRIFYPISPRPNHLDVGVGDSDFEFNTVIKSLRQTGKCVIPNYYSSVEVVKFKAAVDQAFLDNMDKSYYWTDEKGADERIFGAELLHELVHKFFSDQQIMRLCESYMGCKLINACTLIARVRYKTGNKGSGGGWHRDSNARQIKAILFLTDVTEANGPFSFLEPSDPQATSLWSLCKKYRRGSDLRFSESEVRKLIEDGCATEQRVLVSAGTVVLVDTSRIHRGSPLIEGERYALFNYYIPAYTDQLAARRKFNAVEYR